MTILEWCGIIAVAITIIGGFYKLNSDTKSNQNDTNIGLAKVWVEIENMKRERVRDREQMETLKSNFDRDRQMLSRETKLDFQRVFEKLDSVHEHMSANLASMTKDLSEVKINCAKQSNNCKE